MKPRILYTKPSITELETRYAADAAAHGWGKRCYEYLTRFEKGFAAHLGVKHAIATSSCTGALHLGMAGLGIGAGDEVILADTNWIASASPIVHLGATPCSSTCCPTRVHRSGVRGTRHHAPHEGDPGGAPCTAMCAIWMRCWTSDVDTVCR